MILLHEGMPDEAAHLQRVIKQVFNIPVLVLEDDLDRLFIPLPRVQGFHYLPTKEILLQEFPGAAVLCLTRRDLYQGDQSQDDQWVFGAIPYDGHHSAVATARLMGNDNSPRTSPNIGKDLYLRRLSLVAVHELAHDLVNAPHYQNAAWVNVRNGISMSLGPHCTDHSCAMYEVVDVTAPPADEGYLQLGDSCFYDAGIDELLARLRPDWFCPRCRDHLVIMDEYRSINRESI